MSEASKGKPKSQAHRDALSVAKTGKLLGPHSEEHKRKISESNRLADRNDAYRQDESYRQLMAEKTAEVWRKRRAGELPMPNHNKATRRK
jgi:hypothetical protein